MKLTPWFGMYTSPLRRGVYEAEKVGDTPVYQYWNGTYWGGWAPNPKAAVKNNDFPSSRQNHQWRGLAKKP